MQDLPASTISEHRMKLLQDPQQLHQRPQCPSAVVPEVVVVSRVTEEEEEVEAEVNSSLGTLRKLSQIADGGI